MQLLDFLFQHMQTSWITRFCPPCWPITSWRHAMANHRARMAFHQAS